MAVHDVVFLRNSYKKTQDSPSPTCPTLNYKKKKKKENTKIHLNLTKKEYNNLYISNDFRRLLIGYKIQIHNYLIFCWFQKKKNVYLILFLTQAEQV